MSDVAAETASETPPTAPPADVGDTVAPDAPKPAARGKFSAETMATLQALKANPKIDLDDVYVPDDQPPPVKVAPAAKAPAKHAEPAVEAKVAPAPAESPPVSPDVAAVIAERERITARLAELDKREAAIRDREAQYVDVGTKLAANPYDAIRELARANLGAGASDAEIDAEVTDLLTEASLKMAGATIDPKDDKAALRSLQREMRQTKAERRREAAKLEAERKTAEAARVEAEQKAARVEQHRQGVEICNREWDSIKASHGWLAAEDAPAELIWSLISRNHERTGQVMLVADAAKQLDAELASMARSKFSKISHLLQPAAAATQATPNATGHQGDQPRRSRPLTNADASEDATPPAPPAFQSLAEMRKAQLAKARPLLAQLREAARQGGSD